LHKNIMPTDGVFFKLSTQFHQLAGRYRQWPYL
jgi:hypothetical protein